MVTWGSPVWGGNSAAQHWLRNVRKVQAAECAFAAIVKDGSVVTWSHRSCGGTEEAPLRATGFGF